MHAQPALQHFMQRTVLIVSSILLLSACDKHAQNTASSLKPEKMELCRQATQIYQKQHPEYASYAVKRAVFNSASNGNSAVQIYLNNGQPVFGMADHQQLKIECSFVNDYEYSFKASSKALV